MSGFEEKEAKRQEKLNCCATDDCDNVMLNVMDAVEEEEEEEFLPDVTPKAKRQKRNMLKLDRFVAHCDKLGIGDRVGAALVTALLEDLNMVTPDDRTNVIDIYKIRREKLRVRSIQKEKKRTEIKGKLKCVGFDGKSDKNTKVFLEMIKDDGDIELVKDEITEDHVVYTDPDYYLTHSVVDEGCGDGPSLGRDVVQIIQDNESEGSIEAFVCDGTRVKTGCYNGCIAAAERELRKEEQWLICQLHGN